MRVQRRPYGVLAAWTGLAAVPMVWLNGRWRCRSLPAASNTALGQTFARLGFTVVAFVWLLGAIVLARRWTVREPTIAIAYGLAAAGSLGFVAVPVYAPTGFDEATQTYLYVAWVVALGLQLPPVWRLADRARASMAVRVVVAVMALATAVAALTIVLVGTDILRGGRTIVFITWSIFTSGLLVVTLAAWRAKRLAPTVATPLAVGSIATLLVPIGLVAPGEIAYVILAALPVSAIAWLWVGRSTGAAPSDREPYPRHLSRRGEKEPTCLPTFYPAGSIDSIGGSPIGWPSRA